jgi:hypothetical protein
MTILVDHPDLPEYEEISNPPENWPVKKAYYDKAYDDELRLKANTDIRIVGWRLEEDYPDEDMTDDDIAEYMSHSDADPGL